MGVRLPDDIVYTSIETQKMMPTGSTTSMHSDFSRREKKQSLETFDRICNFVKRRSSALMSLLIDLCITDCLFYPYPKKTEIS